MTGLKKDSKNKKWYQKAWNGIKKVGIITYKALTSNIVSISLAAVTIALGVATGGIVPISIAAVIVTVKLVRIGIDAAKAVKIRNLDIENKALIEYATALYVQQKMLDLQPSLKGNGKDQAIKNKLSKSKKLQSDQSLNNADKIVSILDIALDISSAVTNPLQAVAVVTHIQKAIIIANKINKGFEISFTKKETEYQDLEITEQLIRLINLERDRGNVGYNNIEDLREQTRKIQVENKAYLKLMQEEDFYSYTPPQIKTKFQEYFEVINNSTPPAQKKESFAVKLFHGIKDAINPYSEYNPNNQLNIEKHSGITAVVRSENEALKIQDVKQKIVVRTMDDMDIAQNKKDVEVIINSAKRDYDKKEFIKDAAIIKIRMEKSQNLSSNETSKRESTKEKIIKPPIERRNSLPKSL
jgi:hypothetical protein